MPNAMMEHKMCVRVLATFALFFVYHTVPFITATSAQLSKTRHEAPAFLVAKTVPSRHQRRRGEDRIEEGKGGKNAAVAGAWASIRHPPTASSARLAQGFFTLQHSAGGSGASSNAAHQLSKPRTGFAQWLLDAALASPLWKKVLVPQARANIVKTAEANGIEWNRALAWIRSQDGPWRRSGDANGSSTNDIYEGTLPLPLDYNPDALPEYYRLGFHAYEQGNLCWEAAFEQELAMRAVGARNFPKHGKRGEDVFRGAFDNALLSVGASIPKTNSTIVDLGCGTGSSTRRIAENWPQAERVIGIDLSPYFVAVGKRLLELAPRGHDDSCESGGSWMTTVSPDARIELRVGDAASTGLPDSSADAVSLVMIMHELPFEIAKRVVDETYRILKPGGQLWICEMDFESPAYAAQRNNALLFSLLRSTEPYLDEYADNVAEVRDYMLDRFASVRIAPATGRHYSLVAAKAPLEEKDDGDVGDSEKDGRGKARGVLEDVRFNPDGSYKVDDTHLMVWESKQK